MIKFEQNEIDYIVREFNIIIEAKNNMELIDNEDLKCSLENITLQEIEEMQKIIDNIAIINTDKGINDLAEHHMYYQTGMFAFGDGGMTSEEVRGYLPMEKEEYFSIYDKITVDGGLTWKALRN